MSAEVVPLGGIRAEWSPQRELAHKNRGNKVTRFVGAVIVAAIALALIVSKSKDPVPTDDFGGDPGIVDTGDPGQNPGPNPEQSGPAAEQTDDTPPEPPGSTTSIEPVPPSISPTSSTNNGYIVIEM